MKPDSDSLPALRTLPAPAVLRTLTQAFAHLSDFQRFVGGLQTALESADFFQKTELLVRDEPSNGAEEGFFSPGALTLPLRTSRGILGALRVAPPKVTRSFGAEDLHLVAGLAEFLSAVLGHARRFQELERGGRLLRLLLNQAPIGIAAFTTTGTLACNDLALRWLGASEETLPAKVGELLSLDPAALPTRGTYHLRCEGRLLTAELRSSTGAGLDGLWILALSDLTSEQRQLLDGLQRELYRCQWRRQPLTFAVLESPQVAPGVLQRLGDLRAHLGGAEIAGPYDGQRLALVAPEISRLQLRARLRAIEPLFSDCDVRVGLAELSPGAATGEELLQTALGDQRSLKDWFKPAVLAHDDYPAINDMVELALGSEFRVVKTSRLEEAHQLLATEPFDILVAELDLQGGENGLALARFARQHQPALRPIFTTAEHPDLRSDKEAVLAQGPLLRKPFSPAALRQAIERALGRPASRP